MEPGSFGGKYQWIYYIYITFKLLHISFILFGQIHAFDTHPTATSFFHSSHHSNEVSLHAHIYTNVNVENDDFKVLTNFKECLLHKFRNNRKKANDLRASMKDDLLKCLSSRYVSNQLPPSKEDRISSFLIHDVRGYMLKTRSCLYDDCEECRQSVITTAEEFEADEFARARIQGGLLFVSTPAVFRMLSEVEKDVSEHFKSPNHIYLKDSFQALLAQGYPMDIL